MTPERIAEIRRVVETAHDNEEFGKDEMLELLDGVDALRAKVRDLQRVVGDQAAEMQAAWSALKACDFHLDEWASGACRLPPTAGPLAVPEAVRQCVDALHLRLAEARAQVAALTAERDLLRVEDLTAIAKAVAAERAACAKVAEAGAVVAEQECAWESAIVLRGVAAAIRARSTP